MIPGLFGTATFDLSVTVHGHHYDTGDGSCAACGSPVPCPARVFSASVISAAGQDPRSYQQPHPMPSPRPQEDPESSQDWEGGFAVTGRKRPLPPAGFDYDRG